MPTPRKAPSDRQRDNALCRPEQHQPRCEYEVGDCQDATTVMLINSATDRGAEKGRDRKRTRKNAEYDSPR